MMVLLKQCGIGMAMDNGSTLQVILHCFAIKLILFKSCGCDLYKLIYPGQVSALSLILVNTKVRLTSYHTVHKFL